MLVGRMASRAMRRRSAGLPALFRQPRAWRIAAGRSFFASRMRALRSSMVRTRRSASRTSSLPRSSAALLIWYPFADGVALFVEAAFGEFPGVLAVDHLHLDFPPQGDLFFGVLLFLRVACVEELLCFGWGEVFGSVISSHGVL